MLTVWTVSELDQGNLAYIQDSWIVVAIYLGFSGGNVVAMQWYFRDHRLLVERPAL